MENIYKLAAAVRAQTTKFEPKYAGDKFRVVIRGLVPGNLTVEERAISDAAINAAVSEVRYFIGAPLLSLLRDTFGSIASTLKFDLQLLV